MAELDEVKIDIGLEIRQLRINSNLTQKELARRMKTQQPSIARVESGRITPSVEYLHRIAEATGTKLLIKFIPKDNGTQ